MGLTPGMQWHRGWAHPTLFYPHLPPPHTLQAQPLHTCSTPMVNFSAATTLRCRKLTAVPLICGDKKIAV